MPRTVLHRGRRPVIGAGLILFLASAALLPGGEAAKKASVPGKADFARAEALVRELYKAEYTAAAKDVGARGRLAGTFLQEGRETTDDPAGRYVLLREALN